MPPKPRPKVQLPEGVNPWWRALSGRECVAVTTGYPEALRSDFEERAAILEANGSSRDEAEREAFEALVLARIAKDGDEATRARAAWEERTLG